MAAVFAGLGANARADTYPRQPGVDAWHYIFKLDIRDTTSEIAAEATVEFRFVQARGHADRTGPGVRRGRQGHDGGDGDDDGDTPVRFTHVQNVLRLEIPRPPAAGEHQRFTITLSRRAGQRAAVPQEQAR